MVNVTLDERDRGVLQRLREGEADVESLAESVDADADRLERRLPALEDNGLVARVGDAYELTDDGARTLEATAAGTRDDRVDTPPEVEGRILAFDLPTERESAVRGAFSFLHYWGTATGAEIVDGVYSEHPAGYDSWWEWWTGCVRDRLAALPTVEPSRSNDEPWHYDGTPVLEAGSSDGRDVAGVAVTDGTSARFALERLDLDDEARGAVRRVFGRLVELGEVSATEAMELAYPERDAGYRAPEEWWNDGVRPALESLPGVEQVDESGERWRYRPRDDT